MFATRDRTDYDVVIVGARCAGAATARLLAQAGARVLVLDRAPLGSDTLSTSYLMRGAVVQLQRWGLLPKLVEADTPVVRATHFHYESRTVTVPVRAAGGIPGLFAPRRTVLDPLLVEAAREAGAEVRFGARVQGLLRRPDGRVCGVQVHSSGGSSLIRASTVIGADGLPSSVARWVETPTYRVGRHGDACLYAYFENVGIDAYHWFYVRGLAGGIAPTNDGLATAFVAAPPHGLPELHADRQAGMRRMAHALSPWFGDMLDAGRRVGGLRTFSGVRGYYRRPWGPGWALVGDAGYFRDPNTAHGISDALRDAELLANALVEGTQEALARYHETRDRVTSRLFEASDRLASGAWSEMEVEQLLRDASDGMRDSLRVVQALDDTAQRSGSSGSVEAAAVSPTEPASPAQSAALGATNSSPLQMSS